MNMPPTRSAMAGAGSAPAVRVCANCGAPTERHPSASFCAACLCERTKRSDAERGRARWLRIKADPKQHAARLDRRRLRDADRRIEEPGYLRHVRSIQRRWAKRVRRETAHKVCALCSRHLPIKFVNHGRLSNRKLHDECRQAKKLLRSRWRYAQMVKRARVA